MFDRHASKASHLSAYHAGRYQVYDYLENRVAWIVEMVNDGEMDLETLEALEQALSEFLKYKRSTGIRLWYFKKRIRQSMDFQNWLSCRED